MGDDLCLGEPLQFQVLNFLHRGFCQHALSPPLYADTSVYNKEPLTPPMILLTTNVKICLPCDVKFSLPSRVKFCLPAHVKNCLPNDVKKSLPSGGKIILPCTSV